MKASEHTAPVNKSSNSPQEEGPQFSNLGDPLSLSSKIPSSQPENLQKDINRLPIQAGRLPVQLSQKIKFKKRAPDNLDKENSFDIQKYHGNRLKEGQLLQNSRI